MYGHPGKKLNFMGNEIAQSSEWNHDSSINWHLLDYDKHAGVQRLYKDLNHLYRDLPALHEGDHKPEGFAWIDHENSDQSVLSMVRKTLDGKQKVYVISNFTPIPRDGFRLGVEDAGNYELALNTDDGKYWGSSYGVETNTSSEPHVHNHKEHSISINLPPLATLFIVYKG